MSAIGTAAGLALATAGAFVIVMSTYINILFDTHILLKKKL